MSFFIPGKAETVIDYDCVPTYSQTIAAQIIDMNDNVIIPMTAFKSGTIDLIASFSNRLVSTVSSIRS